MLDATRVPWWVGGEGQAEPSNLKKRVQACIKFKARHVPFLLPLSLMMLALGRARIASSPRRTKSLARLKSMARIIAANSTGVPCLKRPTESTSTFESRMPIVSSCRSHENQYTTVEN